MTGIELLHKLQKLSIESLQKEIIFTDDNSEIDFSFKELIECEDELVISIIMS